MAEPSAKKACGAAGAPLVGTPTLAFVPHASVPDLHECILDAECQVAVGHNLLAVAYPPTSLESGKLCVYAEKAISRLVSLREDKPTWTLSVPALASNTLRFASGSTRCLVAITADHHFFVARLMAGGHAEATVYTSPDKMRYTCVDAHMETELDPHWLVALSVSSSVARVRYLYTTPTHVDVPLSVQPVAPDDHRINRIACTPFQPVVAVTNGSHIVQLVHVGAPSRSATSVFKASEAVAYGLDKDDDDDDDDDDPGPNGADMFVVHATFDHPVDDVAFVTSPACAVDAGMLSTNLVACMSIACSDPRKAVWLCAVHAASQQISGIYLMRPYIPDDDDDDNDNLAAFVRAITLAKRYTARVLPLGSSDTTPSEKEPEKSPNVGPARIFPWRTAGGLAVFDTGTPDPRAFSPYGDDIAMSDTPATFYDSFGAGFAGLGGSLVGLSASTLAMALPAGMYIAHSTDVATPTSE
jgi:hypothetical protein